MRFCAEGTARKIISRLASSFPCFLAVILIFYFFVFSSPSPVFASSLIAEFLCEEGIREMKEGDIPEAEDAFRRALLAEPDYPPALYYLEIIQGRTSEGQVPPEEEPSAAQARLEAIEAALGGGSAGGKVPLSAAPRKKIAPAAKGAKSPYVYLLNDPAFSLQQPFKIQEGKSIVISGSDIKRFLSVQPELFSVERINENEILISARGRGRGTVVVWSDLGRMNIACLGIMPIPDTPPLDEMMRREQAFAENFKLHYNLDWYSYYTGRRLGTVNRSGSYSWIHNLRFDGATPYGLLDFEVTERVASGNKKLTYISAGLDDGKWGDLKGFKIRAGDFNPLLNNLAMPGADLRGCLFLFTGFRQYPRLYRILGEGQRRSLRDFIHL
jgi:hypothetical protein